MVFLRSERTNAETRRKQEMLTSNEPVLLTGELILRPKHSSATQGCKRNQYYSINAYMGYLR